MTLACLMVLALVLASCGPAAEAPAEEEEEVSEEPKADEPQYGGWINIGFGGSTVTEVFDPIITSSHGWTSYVTYERLAIADDVICNTGYREDLCQKVARLHEKYLALALNKG